MSTHRTANSPRRTQDHHRFVVLVIGGDGRRFGGRHGRGVEIRACASSKYGGNGRLHGVLAAIRAGAFDLVLVMIRWLGHSESAAITAACRIAGVPFRMIPGGMTSASRALSRHVEEVHRGH